MIQLSYISYRYTNTVKSLSLPLSTRVQIYMYDCQVTAMFCSARPDTPKKMPKLCPGSNVCRQ